ncbi:MAG: hypothetical protein QOF48_2283 [Verrucomicrobiota bacterium]|jgi:ABC-type transport system involved in multi-copper enzyme maturation permease subunit
MTFLPIVTRELIEASRRRGTYWLRVVAAAAGLGIGGFVLLLARKGAHPGEIGMYLFVPLAIACFIYTHLMGVVRTADCLSEEKREGTLGLLFLTDLKGYDIVLGKLAATSLNAFYGMLALFPVMAIPLLAGGVAIGDFWRVVLVSTNTLFLSLAIGMFCSSISRDERRAMVLAFVMLFVFTAGFPILGALMCQSAQNWTFFPAFLVLSPGYDGFGAFEGIRKVGSPFTYWKLSVILIHALSWMFLALACFIVPRTWQDKARSAAAQKRFDKMNRIEQGSPGAQRIRRRRLLDLNPFYWLAARDGKRNAAIWGFLGIGAVIWFIGLMVSPTEWRDPVAYVWTALIVHTVLKLWIATESSRRFSYDRQSGALELLLATPLSVKEILRGQWLALERKFALPMLVVLIVDFVFLMAQRHETSAVYVWVAGMVVFVADMLALAWVGMWRGLNSRRANRAALAAIARLLIFPWLIWIVFSIAISVSASTNPNGAPDWWDGHFPLVTWVVIALGVNLLFGLPAIRGLQTQFRTVATTRFETKGRQGS